MKPKPTIILRNHSVDKVPNDLLSEVKLTLQDYQNVLEELLKIDLEHNWGYANQFDERLGKLNILLEKLK